MASELRSQQREALEEAIAAFGAEQYHGAEQYQLALPVIDTHALGQWIQFAVLSSAISDGETKHHHWDVSVSVG